MRLITILLFLYLFSCQSRTKSPLLDRSLFEKGVSQGKVSNELIEASGLVASVKNAEMLWSHNDSGHPPEIFLIDKDGKIKMKCLLKGIRNRDWEDIAIGAGPEEGKTYVYVGDIGDNLGRYQSKYIYRLEEPVFDEEEKVISDFDTITVTLPDGERDAEALTVDPLSKKLVLISKREDFVHVYSFSAEDSCKKITAEKMGVIPFHKIVAADISADGKEVLMKDYERVYYWKRLPGENIADLLKREPVRLPYNVETQGEAICFARDSTGYYTLSEGNKIEKANLMFYKRKSK